MGTPEVPLEHAQETLEHHAHAASEPWIMKAALTAAILAAMAAITALCAEHCSNEAMLEALSMSDHYNESQADSIKEKILETKEITLDSLKHEHLSKKEKEKLASYRKSVDGKPTIEDLREEAEKEQKESEKHMRQHLPLSAGLTLFQVAIAVCAISALTKQRAFWITSIGLGLVGTGFLVWGLFLVK